MRDGIGISVIIPVYNAAASVRNAVESLISQDYAGLEIILVNDGSTDDSGNVCDELASGYREVCVLHKPNGGVSSARNAGLDAAVGEYVMFLDADDVLKPGSLKDMAFFEADLIMGGFEKVAGGKVMEVNVPSGRKVYEGAEGVSRFLDDNIGEKDCFLLNSSCFKLYRRSLIEANGHRFDESLRYGEDKIFVFGFLRYVQSAATVPEAVYEYRIQDESLSSDVSSDRHLSQIFMLIRKYVPLLSDLKSRYASSVRLSGLYHSDVVSRYICRILTCFAKRPSVLMNHDALEELYAYMSEDAMLGLCSVRPGQFLNILLFKLGNIRISMAFYRFTSSICRYISFK